METLEIEIRRDFLDTIYGLHILRNMIWPLECAVSLRLLRFGLLRIVEKYKAECLTRISHRTRQALQASKQEEQEGFPEHLL